MSTSSNNVMRVVAQALIAALILGAGFFAAKYIRDNAPEPRRRPAFNQAMAVDATRVNSSDYTVKVTSQGTVRPSREGSLVAQITGPVIGLSEQFVTGGYFRRGDVLVEIEPRDYEIALTQAQASLAQARAVLQEEQARSRQARADWKSMGRKGEPSALTARLPQVAAAKANLAAGEAQVEKAELDLSRTRLVAPYDGRVISKQVDIGEFVNRGQALGRVHALDAAEVRLPLSAKQLRYLALPGQGGAGAEPAEVLLSAEIAGEQVTWPGRLVRTEGVDTSSQQLFSIVTVDDPENVGSQPLRVGQYVRAQITGATLNDVVVIPRTALREEREVVLVDAEQQLLLQPVEVAWADAEVAAIASGLEPEQVLVTTTLDVVFNGTPVVATVDGVAPARGDGQRGQGGRPLNVTGEGQRQPGNRGADGGNGAAATGGRGGGAGGGDARARFGAMFEQINAGEELAAEDKQWLRERIANGQRVPPPLRAQVEAAGASQ